MPARARLNSAGGVADVGSCLRGLCDLPVLLGVRGLCRTALFAACDNRPFALRGLQSPRRQPGRADSALPQATWRIDEIAAMKGYRVSGGLVVMNVLSRIVGMKKLCVVLGGLGLLSTGAWAQDGGYSGQVDEGGAYGQSPFYGAEGVSSGEQGTPQAPGSWDGANTADQVHSDAGTGSRTGDPSRIRRPRRRMGSSSRWAWVWVPGRATWALTRRQPARRPSSRCSTDLSSWIRCAGWAPSTVRPSDCT